ncbi:Hpt domain-containing protein [Rheinheimera salexigens]|uniref:HPt domain-containing protein n=1 Tax=Rheinheimera salexigens TaxID=1628148 RepID=A0A1E7Q3U7_9GAMM|nr:Hpt domain-containing protein [Rheinheimera salexigens]OEY68874.1 hypothetical protein BI198_04305 [Rheinheimera salexigens]
MNLLNTATLKKLLLLSNKNQAPLLHLLQTMVDNCSPTITALQQAFSSNDAVTAQHLLHKVRGSFATIGAEQFAQQCAELEQQLQIHTLPSQAEQNLTFNLYQDSCTELQLFIQQQAAAKDSVADIDLHHLLHLLEQQNMAATALASTGTAQLKLLLPAKEVANFFQQLAILNYSAAATLLRTHLVAKHYNKRGGDLNGFK